MCCDWFLTDIAIGMTNANMKLVVLSVTLLDKMEKPKAKLEEGEFIVTRVVELNKLNEELNGMLLKTHLVTCA